MVSSDCINLCKRYFPTLFLSCQFYSVLLAFFASFSRGYLLPFAFIILTLILANFIGFVGLGPYFPWAVPGILSVPPAEDIHLNNASYIILFLTSILGYAGTLAWWHFAHQK